MPSLTFAYNAQMSTPNLRERKRRLMQSEITAIALRLFRERGYSETTVDDLAAASGMSRRTFFRYFPSKEDVISGKWVGMGEDMIARLLARPGDEDPWTSVRASMSGIVDHYADPDRRADSFALDEVIDSTPSLRAAFIAKVDILAEAVAAVLGKRGVEPFHAQVIGRACGAALTIAMRESRARGAEGIGEDLDRAMREFASGL